MLENISIVEITVRYVRIPLNVLKILNSKWKLPVIILISREEIRKGKSTIKSKNQENQLAQLLMFLLKEIVYMCYNI